MQNLHHDPQNISDIINCNLKKEWAILMIFGTSIADPSGHKMTFQFPTSPNVCFCSYASAVTLLQKKQNLN